MKANLKITRVKDGSFTGDDGDRITYFWVKGEDTETGLTIEFGTKRPDYEVGDEVEVELEKTEKVGGGFRYKEVL